MPAIRGLTVVEKWQGGNDFVVAAKNTLLVVNISFFLSLSTLYTYVLSKFMGSLWPGKKGHYILYFWVKAML